MIITAEEFAELRPDISKGWTRDRAKVERAIETAESVDLYDVLGPFYFDVEANKAEVNYTDLMNGSTYQVEGQNYRHIGLKEYLAGLACVRYLTSLNVNITPFGVVNKLSQDSQPLDPVAIRDLKKEEQRTLEIEFTRIDNYLRNNKELFPTYNKGNNPDINHSSIKTSTLR